MSQFRQIISNTAQLSYQMMDFPKTKPLCYKVLETAKNIFFSKYSSKSLKFFK